jgi:hypothetical protein
VAKVLVRRLGPACVSVKTAFVPGRDIADNVLLHLEEIDYVQEVQQPRCIVFLDFEIARYAPGAGSIGMQIFMPYTTRTRDSQPPRGGPGNVSDVIGNSQCVPHCTVTPQLV